MEHLTNNLCGKNRAAGLVRVDWTNAYRGPDFCLPVSQVKRVDISSAQDVMNLGGCAAVSTLMMGFGDDFEAENMHSISQLIRDSYELSLPVFIDVRPIGPGVSEVNFDDAIKLSASFMMEAGADAMIIPNCSLETLELISNWSTIPVIMRIDELLNKAELDKILNIGINGILFSEKILEDKGFLKKIEDLK